MITHKLMWKVVTPTAAALLLGIIDQALDKAEISTRQAETLRLVSRALVPMAANLLVLAISSSKTEQSQQFGPAARQSYTQQ